MEETRNRELLRKESQQIGNKVKEASTGDGKSFIGTRAFDRSKEEWQEEAKNKKGITTLMSKLQSLFVATKKSGTATGDAEINRQLLFHSLDADGIEDLLQRIHDVDFLITDKDGEPGARVSRNKCE